MTGVRAVDAHAAALRWIAEDPDRNTQEELRRLLDGEHADELADRMSGPLRFGTAGLRGKVRAGPAGMNIAVVRRTTAGLASWLRARGGGRLVVVGRDARLGSARFAAAAAGVLAAAGFDVIALAEPLPTPLLAYAVRQRRAVAGVQITASHNPPTDNGYKVFLGGPDEGAQLVEPADAQIEAAISAAPPAAEIPCTPVPETNPEGLVWHYLDRLSRLPFGTARKLRIALTPLHGVGGAVAVRALRAAGFTDVRLVPSQADPNPAFPTVAFPNPEEPGAVDALLELAARTHADLAVALDPDADRCALGVPDPEAPGGWRMLTGNETGALLGEHLLANLDRTYYPDPLVATTVASSRQLREIAAAHGARFAETLTGFKWIVRAGDDTAGAPGFVYGFEEALGYCVDPDGVRDKDGIAAAVLAADLVATRKARGESLHTALDELAVAHGVHLTEAVTFPLAPADRDEVLARLDHISAGVQRPAPDVLVINGTRGRAVIRPSGTEPKLKAYLEVTEQVDDPAGLPAVRERAAERLAELREQVTELVSV